MYKLPEEIKTLYKENKEMLELRKQIIFEVFIDELRNKIEPRPIEVKYCEIRQNGWSEKTYILKPTLKELLQDFTDEHLEKIRKFRQLIDNAWKFEFMFGIEDVNEYLKTGKIRL